MVPINRVPPCPSDEVLCCSICRRSSAMMGTALIESPPCARARALCPQLGLRAFCGMSSVTPGTHTFISHGLPGSGSSSLLYKQNPCVQPMHTSALPSQPSARCRSRANRMGIPVVPVGFPSTRLGLLTLLSFGLLMLTCSGQFLELCLLGIPGDGQLRRLYFFTCPIPGSWLSGRYAQGGLPILLISPPQSCRLCNFS